jgi:segregation and condensation protein B
MAKRKKSKKPAKSKSAVEVQAPEANENADTESVESAEGEPPAEGEAQLVESAAGEAQLVESAEGEPPAEGESIAEGNAFASETEDASASDDLSEATVSEWAEPWADDGAQALSREGESAVSQTDDGSGPQGEIPFAEGPDDEPAAEGEGSLPEGVDGQTADGDAPLAEGADGETPPAPLSEAHLESIIESLLFASDKALGLHDLKRLLGERDGKKINAAVESLIEHRKGTGIEVIALSTGWHLRTSVENASWVSKLLVGRPVRLSRAMLETLAIVAYRQPVTRPEVDDIRGVDCGAVLKTLLDRGLIRIIGKKEEVGRPMLYGTTPEFLRVFNLRDLSELPTLREFYDLSAEDQSRVEAEHGSEAQTPSATTAKPDVALTSVARGALSPEPEENDPLLDELDEASQLAKKALGDLEPPAAESEEAAAPAEDKGPRSSATE